jgi:hypothetical protein
MRKPTGTTTRCIHERSVLVSTSRNAVLRERSDSRTYLTRFGLRVVVRTIWELEDYYRWGKPMRMLPC